jgi:hypothetical protein
MSKIFSLHGYGKAQTGDAEGRLLLANDQSGIAGQNLRET